MKFFAALVIFGAVFSVQAGFSEDQTQKLAQHNKECLVESGVDKGIFAKAQKGEFVNDPKLKEHVLCVQKKIGFLNPAGKVQKDVLKLKLTSVLNDEGVVAKLIEKCAVEKDKPQETAFKMLECYWQNSPNHAIHIL